MKRTIEAEKVNGVTWIVFVPGELGLRIRGRGLIELVANTPTAALALDQFRIGTLRALGERGVELRIALKHDEASLIEIRDAGAEGKGSPGTIEIGE